MNNKGYGIRFDQIAFSHENGEQVLKMSYFSSQYTQSFLPATLELKGVPSSFL